MSLTKIEKIIETAKILLPEVKSRNELAEKLAEQFHLSMSTINVYLCKKHFKTGFRHSPMDVSKSFREYQAGRTKIFEDEAIKFFEFVQEKPRYLEEVRVDFPYHRNFYLYLRSQNFPIQRTKLSGSRSLGKREHHVIYYLLSQREETFNMLVREFPQKFYGLMRPVLDGEMHEKKVWGSYCGCGLGKRHFIFEHDVTCPICKENHTERLCPKKGDLLIRKLW
jgi:hypothetical protein